MHEHAPASYVCPFCEFLAGRISEFNNADDIVCRHERATAFIGPLGWENNAGSVLVIPNTHYENIYSIPDDDFAAAYKLVKQVSNAMRSTYDCGGTTIIQRSEPAAGQHV